MEAKASVDDRFYTPRSSARRSYSSASSEDERFMSPRGSARSVSSDDNEYSTPRETPSGVVPRLPSSNVASMSPTAAYKDVAFRASSKQRSGGGDPPYDAFEYKLQPRSGSVSELRRAAPPADDYDLFSAARHNRLDSVAYMLDQGVSVNSLDAFGNTLLSIACQNGLKRMAKLALRRGANATDMVCERPTTLAAEHEDERMEEAQDVRRRGSSEDLELEAEMLRVDPLDAEWRRQMHAGDPLDAQNPFGNWCPARVLQIADGEVLLQFLNMHDMWRQWFPMDSGRLAAPGSKARNDSVSIRQAQQIEVRPGGGNSSLWKEAFAVRAIATTVLVRFAGRDQKFDEWIPFTPATVAPAGDHLQLRGRGGTLQQRQLCVTTPETTRRRVIQAQNPRFAHYRDALQATLGLGIFDIEGDGNCLFRSVSHQIYGNDRHHALVRAACMDYMESEKEYFEPYVVGDMAAFMRYLRYKRRDGVWGDDPELQAMCELYDRPAEVFAYDSVHGFRKLRSFHENGALSRNRPPIRLSYYGGGHYDSLVGSDFDANVIRETPGEWEQRHIGYSRRINSRETRDDVSGVELQRQTQSERERTEVEQMEHILMVSSPGTEHDRNVPAAQAHREREEVEEATRQSEMAAIQAELLAKAKEASEEEQMKSAIQASLGGQQPVSDNDFDAQVSAAIQASLGGAGSSAAEGAGDYDEQLRRAMELSAEEYAPPAAFGFSEDDSANTDEMDELQRAIQASLQQT
ncbi:hypothetical protein BBJ28_00019557 [Nothophytophthora sp. Chile5]|nr:hypothetical protein BBJ28_00019557 [Nothophytophthora sp. Chile5]